MREDRVGVLAEQRRWWVTGWPLVGESDRKVNDVAIGVDYWVARDRVGRSLVTAEIRVDIGLNAV